MSAACPPEVGSVALPCVDDVIAQPPAGVQHPPARQQDSWQASAGAAPLSGRAASEVLPARQ